MHSKKQTYVKALLFDKALIKVLAKYFDHSNIFLLENIAKHLENTKINKYAMKLEKGKRLLWRPINSLELVELEILKIYIKIKLANSFI